MRQPQTGGLSLPDDIGISESSAAAIEKRWSTIAKVDERLRLKGIHANDQPDVVCPPVTTAALVTTDINEYTTVFSAQLRWYNYTTRLLADVRAIILEVKNAMSDIEVEKREHFRKLNEGRAKPDKMDKQEMEDAIELDPQYRDLKLQFQELEQERIKIDAWSESLDRSLKTVSRQIENRKAEGMGGSRENNMTGSARGSWGEGRGGFSRPQGR